jgi:hypothetical protein
MKTTFIRLTILIALATTAISCGSSKNAAETDRKKKEQKEKSDKLDEDKRRFEMQNNKDLK